MLLSRSNRQVSLNANDQFLPGGIEPRLAVGIRGEHKDIDSSAVTRLDDLAPTALPEWPELIIKPLDD